MTSDNRAPGQPPASGQPLPPVAIGGVGGSGTRVVADLLRNLGVHTGTDLNHATDTLWFTLLFKRPCAPDCSDEEFDALTGALVAGLGQGSPLDAATTRLVQRLAMADRPQHGPNWLQPRADSLVEATRQPAHGQRWGWKEPNTHVVIERLWQRLPELRYIHVVRDGLQMATSGNQNQLKLWGPRVLGGEGPVTPQRSLAYWCHVHRRVQALQARNAHRMLWVDYDELSRDPVDATRKIAGFLGYAPQQVLRALPEIKPPARRPVNPADFDPEHVAYVASLGYTVAPTV